MMKNRTEIMLLSLPCMCNTVEQVIQFSTETAIVVQPPTNRKVRERKLHAAAFQSVCFMYLCNHHLLHDIATSCCATVEDNYC